MVNTTVSFAPTHHFNPGAGRLKTRKGRLIYGAVFLFGSGGEELKVTNGNDLLTINHLIINNMYAHSGHRVKKRVIIGILRGFYDVK